MVSVQKSNRVRDIVTFGGLGLLALIAASLYYQFYSLKGDLGSEVTHAKEHARDTNEKLIVLEREMSQIGQEQSSIGSALARLESQISARQQNSPPISRSPEAPTSNAWQTTPAENRAVREFLEKVNGLDPIVEAGYKVGDKIPSDKLRDFSIILTEQVPLLKNTRYTIDQKASIIIVSGEDRVVAILSTAN
jgi:hypothetical protein